MRSERGIKNFFTEVTYFVTMLEKSVSDGNLAEGLGPASERKNLGCNFKQLKNALILGIKFYDLY